jgi:hypothetical protein
MTQNETDKDLLISYGVSDTILIKDFIKWKHEIEEIEFDDGTIWYEKDII